MFDQKHNVLVVGSGTIALPLITFLAEFKKQLNLNVMFHKRSALDYEAPKVNALLERGALLVTDADKRIQFEDMGHKVSETFLNTLSIADVVIDCTPAGNENKDKYYAEFASLSRRFIAQGSETGFGIPYAHGINDSCLKQEKFIQIVSCNTHNIAVLLKTIPEKLTDIVSSDFVCIRRANDISQNTEFVPSPSVDKHKAHFYGTHHAADVKRLFSTINANVPVFSSSLKTNTQYMHTIRFSIALKENSSGSLDSIIERLKGNKFIAMTKKQDTGRVFSFGRDAGLCGRIFNQTVVCEETLAYHMADGRAIISGFCFTPQDSNSTLSSIAATLQHLYQDEYLKYMELFYRFLFKEV